MLLTPIKHILEDDFFNKPEFLLDIQNKIEEENEDQFNSNEIVMETDDAIDYLLCGTDVANSCQDVTYDIEKSKGLLGYLSDGKNKQVVIKNGIGLDAKILARCFLRLLWDEEANSAVIFLDTLFPIKISEKHIAALEYIAKRKAGLLNLPLISYKGSGQPYNSIKSLGSSAPWEYSDHGGGLTNGTYTLKGVKEFLADDHHPVSKGYEVHFFF